MASKIKQIEHIAHETGLPKSVYVQYHRESRQWYVIYPVAIGDYAQLGQDFSIIARFDSVEDAQLQVNDIAQDWLERFGAVIALIEDDTPIASKLQQALQTVAKIGISDPECIDQLLSWGAIRPHRDVYARRELYELTSLGEAMLKLFSHSVISKRDEAYSHDVISVRDSAGRHDTISKRDKSAELSPEVIRAKLIFGAENRESVTLIPEEVSLLLELLPPMQSSGSYEPKETQATTKKAIVWHQPAVRKSPVWHHTIVCEYCGQTVTLERHSSRIPPHCGSDTCSQEHNRLLARRRKRRERANKKEK